MKPSPQQALYLRRIRAGLGVNGAAATRYGYGDLDGSIHNWSATFDACLARGWLAFDMASDSYAITDAGRAAISAD